MTISPWPSETAATLSEENRDLTTQLEAVTEQLTAEKQFREFVEESYADLENLYREDVGWQRIGHEATKFSKDGRDRIAQLADLTITGNALIKRGVALRTAYVWGQGVTVAIKDDGAEGQDVNAVWQDFWDEPSNRAEFTSSEAQVRYERRLAGRGEAFWALPTDPVTGTVRIRHIPAKEIVDRICDPEDAASVWLYKRCWSAVVVNPKTGEQSTEDRTTYYPALGFYPAQRPRTYFGNPIRWDAPMRPVTVNAPDEDWRGMGDVLAAMPWAKMDKEFLEDLAVYMRVLTRILGQVTSKSAGARAKARQEIANAEPGGIAVTDPGTTLNLVSKSGAQIDADSRRPYATNVAAALEVPLTMLLGDPGLTGARATAETLDQPTELTFGLRRDVHTELFNDIAGYVIDQAVIAPAGPLRGGVSKVGDRIVVELPAGDSRTVEVSWPEYDSVPLKDFVDAVVKAEGTEVLPPLVVFKLFAKVFELEDVDDLIDELTDDEGRWLPPVEAAAQAAVDAARDGRDPADTIR